MYVNEMVRMKQALEDAGINGVTVHRVVAEQPQPMSTVMVSGEAPASLMLAAFVSRGIHCYRAGEERGESRFQITAVDELPSLVRSSITRISLLDMLPCDNGEVEHGFQGTL